MVGTYRWAHYDAHPFFGKIKEGNYTKKYGNFKKQKTQKMKVFTLFFLFQLPGCCI